MIEDAQNNLKLIETNVPKLEEEFKLNSEKVVSLQADARTNRRTKTELPNINS